MSRSPTPREVLGEKPFVRLAVFGIDRHYRAIGCDDWTSRRVLQLMAKYSETADLMAARLRISKSDFNDRMEEDRWTKQDGLILTILEREIDLLRSGHTRTPSVANLNP